MATIKAMTRSKFQKLSAYPRSPALNIYLLGQDEVWWYLKTNVLAISLPMHKIFFNELAQKFLENSS